MTPCWIWTGGLVWGYGHFMREDQKDIRAHRWSYRNAYGNCPPLLRHKCDEKKCVRPDHLEPGTQADNVRDRDSRGRQAKGTRQHLAKLTDSQVMQAREMRHAGRTFTEIAMRFGVTRITVTRAIKGQTWKHVRMVADQ